MIFVENFDKLGKVDVVTNINYLKIKVEKIKIKCFYVYKSINSREGKETIEQSQENPHLFVQWEFLFQ